VEEHKDFGEQKSTSQQNIRDRTFRKTDRNEIRNAEEHMTTNVKLTDEDEMDDYLTELETIQETFGKRVFKRSVPKTEFPELFVTLPDSFNQIELAPLYDVHVGSRELDEGLLDKHLDWIAKTPNVFTWNGGDAFENKTGKESHMGHDKSSPEEQLLSVTKKFAKVQHKMFLSISGNHEARTFKQAGMSSAKRLAENLKVPYFPDYAFLTIWWREQRFRIQVHHGAGGGTTPGAQRNSARKELAWYHPDILWTGHVHQQLIDPVKVYDRDQKTGLMYERDILAIVSPSYLKYFNSYGAASRMTPGQRGLTVALLNPNGRIDANVHARGKRI
jgi:hypothetical protein